MSILNNSKNLDELGNILRQRGSRDGKLLFEYNIETNVIDLGIKNPTYYWDLSIAIDEQWNSINWKEFYSHGCIYIYGAIILSRSQLACVLWFSHRFSRVILVNCMCIETLKVEMLTDADKITIINENTKEKDTTQL